MLTNLMIMIDVKSDIDNLFRIAYDAGIGSVLNLTALPTIRFQSVCQLESYWTTRTYDGYQSVGCIWLVWGISSLVALISVFMLDWEQDFIDW